MKTTREIRDAFRNPDFSVQTCLAYYQELHDNGHFEVVKNFLLKGDSVLGKQGYTYNEAIRRFATVQNEPFNDSYGAYAGTYSTFLYNGEVVSKSTSYSLFN